MNKMKEKIIKKMKEKIIKKMKENERKDNE